MDDLRNPSESRMARANPERSALVRRLVAARAAAEKARRRGDIDAEEIARARIAVAREALRDVGDGGPWDA